MLVTQMPLAENSGCVTRILQHLGHGRHAKFHSLAFQDGVGHPHVERCPPRHAGRAGRRTSWADLETGETETLFAQLVDVWRGQMRIPVGGQVVVSLVVRNDEEDVGLLSKPEFGLRNVTLR